MKPQPEKKSGHGLKIISRLCHYVRTSPKRNPINGLKPVKANSLDDLIACKHVTFNPSQLSDGHGHVNWPEDAMFRRESLYQKTTTTAKKAQ